MQALVRCVLMHLCLVVTYNCAGRDDSQIQSFADQVQLLSNESTRLAQTARVYADSASHRASMAATYLKDTEEMSSDVIRQLRITRETVKKAHDGLANATLKLYSKPNSERFRREDLKSYEIARSWQKRISNHPASDEHYLKRVEDFAQSRLESVQNTAQSAWETYQLADSTAKRAMQVSIKVKNLVTVAREAKYTRDAKRAYEEAVARSDHLAEFVRVTESFASLNQDMTKLALEAANQSRENKRNFYATIISFPRQ